MRLAERIFTIDDRLDTIIENRGRPLLADHRDISTLALDLLRDSVETNQPALEPSRAVQIDDCLGPLRRNQLTLGFLCRFLRNRGTRLYVSSRCGSWLRRISNNWRRPWSRVGGEIKHVALES